MLTQLLLSKLGYEQQPAHGFKAASYAGVTTTVWQEDAGWTQTNYPTYAQEGYGGNAIIYACIRRLMETASMAPLEAWSVTQDVAKRDALLVQRKSQGSDMVRERLPYAAQLQALLRRPNPNMSWFELQELAILYLSLDGNSFFNTPRLHEKAEITTILPMRPDFMRPVFAKNGELLGYVQDIDGHRTPFMPWEVMHVRYPDPLDASAGLGRGVSPLRAAAQVGDVDNANTKFLKQFFGNAVVPFGLLKTKQKLTDPMIAGIRERLRSQYAGIRNWGDVMILDTDAEYERLGLDMQELGFEHLDARNEARICAVLGVPPIVAGAKIGLDRGTYSNYEQARRAMWEDTATPMYRRFEDGFDQHFGEAYPATEMRYDFSQVPALRENETERSELAIRAFMSGVAKRNEAREIMNLPPVEEDGFRSNDLLALNAPSVVNDPAAIDLEGDSTLQEAMAALRGARLKARQGNLAGRRKIEDYHVGRIERALAAQLQAVTADRDVNLVDALAAVSATREPLRIALRDMLLEAGELALADAAQFVSDVVKAVQPTQGKPLVSVDWTLIAAYVIDWVETYSFDLIGGIDATTRARLASVISAWIEVGGTMPELIEELTPLFGPVRAEMIAATEITRAYSQASIIAWRASGVVERMVWLTANDEIVCPVCAPLGGLQYGDGEAVPASIEDQQANGVQTTFGSPFLHPGGAGLAGNYAGQTFDMPPAHVRCRCSLSPVISTVLLAALPVNYRLHSYDETWLYGGLALLSHAPESARNGVSHAG